MKKIIKNLAMLLIICVAILALVACEKDNSKDIVGYWLNDELGINFVYSFNEDGTGKYCYTDVEMPFQYTIKGNDISILYDGDDTSFDTKYEINADVLNVKDSNNEDTLYHRIDAKTAEEKLQELPEVDISNVDDEENVPKSEQEGTAGSNIPLKDNYSEAEYQIKVAFQDYLVNTYGTDIFDARINVDKIYTAEDEDAVEPLKEENLGPDEVAFELSYELKLKEGVDPMPFTAANGQLDEESGWITDKHTLGILRPNPSGDTAYVITNMGTGW